MKVGLVQISNSFAGAEYFPYTVGCLQAYAQQRVENVAYLAPIYRRISVKQALEQLDGADIAAFSLYIWNERISLEIARRWKTIHPHGVVIIGGPQVPDQAEAFLRQHPFVDLVVHGEGEEPFTAFLRAYRSRDWGSVPSATWLVDHILRETDKAPRFQELSALPSPYMLGLFNQLLDEWDGEWIAPMETNRGCVFRCRFCDWGSAVGTRMSRFNMQRIRGEVDWCADHRVPFIYICDSNFGIMPRDVEIAQYAADVKKARGWPQRMSVQTTKNATERAFQVNKILNDAGLQKGVTLGIQSLDPHTLEAIDRKNISLETYHELQRRFARDGIPTYTDLILALPGETYDSFTNGVAELIERGNHSNIQFNNLSILPNAEMGSPDYQERHGFEVVECDVVNHHGRVDDVEEVVEKQQLVVATAMMPRQDWVRTRAFCYWASLLHFDKLLQIPFVVMHQLYNVGYRELIETFSELKPGKYPLLDGISRTFEAVAEAIQNGGAEYIRAPAYLNIWWPANEFIFINLVREEELGKFYTEAHALLSGLVETYGESVMELILSNALALNHQLIKRPYPQDTTALPLTYNIWELYQAGLKGEEVPLDPVGHTYRIDRAERWASWEDWMREVVFWGNKTGAYLYSCERVEETVVA